MDKKYIKWIGILVISVLLIGFMIRLIGIYVFQWDWYPFYGHMPWMMPFGMLFMGIFWFIAAYFFIMLFDHRNINQNNSNKETLKKRLSNGEITIEEYEELLEKIKE